MDCQACKLLKEKEAEIKALKRDQDLSFLLMDMILTAVEQWAKQNGLISPAKDVLEKSCGGGRDQIGMLLEQIGEAGQPAALDRLVALLKTL